MGPPFTRSTWCRWHGCSSYVRRGTRRLDIPVGNIEVTFNRGRTSRSGCRSAGMMEEAWISRSALVLLPVRRALLSLATQSQACLISRLRGTAEENSRRLEGQHVGRSECVWRHRLVEQGKNKNEAQRSHIWRVTPRNSGDTLLISDPAELAKPDSAALGAWFRWSCS